MLSQPDTTTINNMVKPILKFFDRVNHKDPIFSQVKEMVTNLKDAIGASAKEEVMPAEQYNQAATAIAKALREISDDSKVERVAKAFEDARREEPDRDREEVLAKHGNAGERSGGEQDVSRGGR